MLKEITLFGEIDKVKIAIERIKEFNPNKIDNEKVYILPFSGGKDSLACYILAQGNVVCLTNDKLKGV